MCGSNNCQLAMDLVVSADNVLVYCYNGNELV